ncbi:MAG: Calx-beta domain-containing protein [Pyrinomonadaceae bacterium]
MSNHSFAHMRRSTPPWRLGVCLAFGLLLLAPCSFRQPANHSHSAHGSHEKSHKRAEQTEASNPTSARREMAGAEARTYLHETSEGQSLARAITAARFGLSRQERGPMGEAGVGYLGMSHEQNLNAWFADEGVTVRPTVAESERERSWHMDMRLKAYGYGEQLQPAPPVSARHVKDNRIEYERAGSSEMRLSDLVFTGVGPLIPQSEMDSKIVEWYENRPDGIEQGFTLMARPERDSAVGSDEPLRLKISLNGDLRARVKNDGRELELIDTPGNPVLSYGKLTASDTDGKPLAAHMEASADGSEIALVVDDRSASYPIVIDPITASLEKILDATGRHQAGAQFGDAVAIDGDSAIVGAWLEDNGTLDGGTVYLFTRTGTAWSFNGAHFSTVAQGRCGYSVAISGDLVAWGCPGVNANAGRANVESVSTQQTVELQPGPGLPQPGDFFGTSVAISDSDVVVGSPSFVIDGKTNVGVVDKFTLDSNLNVTSHEGFGPSTVVQNARFGDSVAIEGNTIFIGVPGSNQVVVASPSPRQTLQANDSASGDLFGQTVALSGDTAVIAAPANDEKGTDAGAAYVFVRDANGQWIQRQKLTAGDGKANDIFSYYAVAIEGNMIVVGARRQDLGSGNPNDNSGAAYIFTRSGTVWNQQAKLSAGGFFRAPGDEFGTSVGISRDTVIVSAPHETATDGTTNAGVSYVYRLNCVPPSNTKAVSCGIAFCNFFSACPGSSVLISVSGAGVNTASIQWRRNGQNIPGATGQSYSINSASTSDVGVYDAVVSNACGSDVSEPFTLSLHTFSLNPSGQNFGAAGSAGIVSVTSTGNCDWTAVSNSPFINITGPTSGTGNGTVGFSVAANPGTTQRTGTLTIAGQTFTVTQDGSAPTPTPTPSPTPTTTTVQFSAANYFSVEDCAAVSVTVTRAGNTSGAASADYATSDGSASERNDYTTALGTLRFAPGETAKSFDVLINEDSFVEGAESFNVSLSNPQGASLGAQSMANVQITDDLSEPASNVIDDPLNYVGQHYHDFLSRQADPPGQNFWANEILSCGTDTNCIQVKRVNVSAAFFLSIEFQQTGYQVILIYKSTYPDGPQHPRGFPRYREFLRDTQEIGRGVVVGQGNWELQLQQNRLDFARRWVASPDFLARFPAAMGATAFVDQLFATSSVAATTAERNAAIAAYGVGNTEGRAQALLSVTNSASVRGQHFNAAFVLMQYLGYLRRMPNDPPDNNFAGFDFWLNKLNQFNGNFQKAEMVRAFLVADEFRRRFGP